MRQLFDRAVAQHGAHRAVREPVLEHQRHVDAGLGSASTVDLRGRLGPFARAKRLRMVRTAHDPDRHARFERVEHDGRDHSPWILDADISSSDAGSTLTTAPDCRAGRPCTAA